MSKKFTGSGRLFKHLLGRLYPGPCRQFDLPDDELAAVTAAIRGVIAGDRYPRAPRLDPLRAALARLEAASKPTPRPTKIPTWLGFETEGPAASRKPDKRARR